MKRIYLLFLLMIALGSNVFAQSSDIVLTKNMADTIKYADPIQTYYVISYSFKNNGPNALPVGAKLVLKTPTVATPRTLNLPPASGSWPGGLPKDSTVYLNDTFGWKAAPSANPANWCDSVWAVNSSNAVIPDPSILPSNRTCKLVYFKPDPLASVGQFVTAEDNLSVYPNPANNVLNIEYNFRNNTNATVVITDILGKVTVKKELGSNLGNNPVPVDITSLSNGLYMLQLSVGDTRLTSKFSVQK